MYRSDASVKAASTCPTYYLLSRREKYVWGLKPSPRQPEVLTPDKRPLYWDSIFCHTFKAIRMSLGIQGAFPEEDPFSPSTHSTGSGTVKERPDMVGQSRSDDSELCHELVSKYGFTELQMRRAAERFHLGRSNSGKTIYWMIDHLGRVYDGHIGDTWVSDLLKLRYPENARYIQQKQCLFGLHQISNSVPQLIEGAKWPGRSIGIVDNERSAVILSEVYPNLVWLAYVNQYLFLDRFEPLQGRTVTLFPRAATYSDYYWSACELADQVSSFYKTIDIHVSTFLEDHATESQKSHNIDLVDFLFD